MLYQSGYDRYMLNTKVSGTNQKGEITENGILTLKLYYDKILEHNFNINLKNQDKEDGVGIENTKYDINIKYSSGETKEYKDQTTNAQGNLVIPNIPGKSNMTIYIKQTSITQGYEKDTKKNYVGIRVNANENGIEIYGNKSEEIIANVEEDTLYLIHQNTYLNNQNILRINVKDKKDNDIKIPNVKFEVLAPNGTLSQIESDEDGIAKIDNLVAPGIGDFLYEIEQIDDVYGYEKINKIHLNITFDESGTISGASIISGDVQVNIKEEIERTYKNKIADIDMQLQRSGTNGPFGDYTIKIIEKDVDTGDFIEGVRYKIIQKATAQQISRITTINKTTSTSGEIVSEAMSGEKLLLRLKRSKVPDGYKFDRSEFKVEFQTNAEGKYELVEPNENVIINDEEKVIIINRTNYLKNSQSNLAGKRVNNTLYITKVDESLRPLKDVVMELRENSTGTKWKLKTDENGLAKLTDGDIINSLGSVFPQHLTESEGKLTFWITEESVPVGYERIDEDIGFEAYYEYTPEGVLEISYMNVLDGLSYYHIVDQEYDQYEEEDYTQVDIRLKVINRYGRDVDTTKFKTIEIEKVDLEDNRIKLAGATFKIRVSYPEVGGMTTDSTTNKNGILNFNKLYFPEGKSIVQIIETSAPLGYASDKTPVIIEVENKAGQINVTSEDPSVKIDETGKITLKVENVKKEKVVPYNIVIEKRDSETDELIEYSTGFNVTVSQSDVKNNYSRTTSDGTTSVSNLNGRGTIKIEVEETRAPIGYKKQSGKQTITINKQNLMSSISLLSSTSNVRMYENTIYVTMYNEKDYAESTWKETPILEIKKVDNQNRDLGLKKARFKITMPNGTRIVETLTRGNTALYLSGAVSGRYIIEEINAPSGYEKAKKIALDITFDNYNNIKTCEIVQGLGDEYQTSVIQKNASGKRIFLKIGDSRTKTSITGGDTYSLHIDKVSSKNYNTKLDGAKFDISITQQNGTDYHLTRTTDFSRGIYVSGLYGTGKIIVTLRETKSPSGYEFNGQTRKIVFTRDEQTKRLTLVDSELVNISRSDISFNTYGNMITIRVKNKPLSYTPIIGVDEPNNPGDYNPGEYNPGEYNPGDYNPSDPNYGKPYNSIIIENEYIRDHSVKIKGTTFEIYRLGSYISKGTTDIYGLTRISLGNTEYYTTEEYLIKNVYMQDKSYIKNKDVILSITYNSNGKMQHAEIISGRCDDEGRIAAQIDPDFDYVGENVIKVDIRCDKKTYTSATGIGGGGTSGESQWESGTTGGGTINPTPSPKPEGNIPSPIRPIPGEAEPDFGILLEKVHLFNEKIKVKDAQYVIYIYNEETKESTSKIAKTNSKGQILFGGLLGYGNFTITIVETLEPAEYLLDENRHTIRINRDETSQLITLLDNNYNQNLTAKVDNINKIVNVKIKETPSSMGIAIQKQDYDDDLITLKNAKFEITDVATSEKYELITGEEGIDYINLPLKPDGTYTFRINEIEAPGGYRITSGPINLKVRYLNGIIAEAYIDGENEYADVTRQDAEYIELSVLNQKNEEGLKYDIELIKADAYYSSITFKDAKIKLKVDNESGQSGVVKTSLTDEDGKIYLNNIYGNGKATIKITEIEPPPGRRFDIKPKQVVLNINKENSWIKLDNCTSNVDTYIDNDTKKVKIRIRNYPDGTFIMGANKVDANDHNIILTGAKYSVKIEGGNDLYELKDYKEGLMALQDIPMPNMSGEYTYTITELEAPFGYALDTTPIILKIEVSLINGIKVITNAYIQSGNAEVEKYGDEYVHLLLYDNLDTTSINPDLDKGYSINVIKIDNLNHEYKVPNTLINVHVEAESGENYYKEIRTDELGKINLNNIRGTGRIQITLAEIDSASKYIKDEQIKKITFTRDKDTGKITIEKVEGNGIISNVNENNIELLFENELNGEIAKSITVKKIWNDEENKSKRPTSIKLQIKNEAGEVVASKIVDKTYENPENSNEWIYVFSALDKLDKDNNIINYKISEAEVNEEDLKFYAANYDEETKTITNTFRVPEEMVNERINITGHKVWVDTELQKVHRPKNIKVQLKRGTEVIKEEIITTEDNKDIIFTNVKKYDENGDEIVYTISETEVNTNDLKFYVGSYDEETKTITNTFSLPSDIAEEKTNITGHKVWVDTELQKGKRPTSIELQLKKGNEIIKEEIITTESDKDITFTDVKKYDENGNEIVYTISETEVNTNDLKFYVGSYDEETKTITNTFRVPSDMAGEKISITGHKVWVDTELQKTKRPVNIKIQVKNGNEVIKEEIITTEGNKDIIFTDIPKYDENGEEIVYTISETEVNTNDLRFYVGSYDEETKTITNTFRVPSDMAEEKISITGHKVWVDTELQKVHRPQNIKIQLKKGAEILKEATITTESNKDITFTDAKKYDENGNEIVYTISETEVNANDLRFYVASYDEETKTITNTFKVPEEMLKVTIQKVIKGTTTGLEGAKITLIDEENKEYTATTNKEGYVTFVGVQVGKTYKYKETSAPLGYDINQTEYSFRMEEDGTIVDVIGNRIIEDERIKVSIDITKYEKDSTIPLLGAEIGIYREDGQLVEINGKKLKGITNKRGKVTLIGLEPGTYYYKEIKAPIGYLLNENSYKFIVKEDGSIEFENDTKGILYNEKHLIDVQIKKVVKGTNIGIPGAKITLIDEENKEYTATTNQEGYVTFVGVQVGKTYKYKETSAPLGYTLNENEYSFRVEENEIIVDITGNRIIENERIKVNVTIIKYEKGSTTPLAGAEIGIYGENGQLIQINGVGQKGITNEQGNITFIGLEPGTYYYKEITSPTGYLLNENTYKFIVKEDGNIEFENDTKGILYNEKHLIDVTIKKVIKGTNIGIAGAGITLIDEANNEYKAITNSEGNVTFVGVQVGKTYKYKETKAPLGYILNEKEYSFRVEANEIIVDIVGNRTIENERIKVNVSIIKYEEGSTTPLAGAEIGLYDNNGNVLAINGKEQKGITNEQGNITFIGLEPGTYYYKEITSPTGYLLNENTYKFIVKEDGNIEFENDTKGILYNEKHLVDVTIKKVLKGTNIGIAGAEITLIDDQQKEYKAITNKDGLVTFVGLQLEKTYKYKETTAPLGYNLNENEYSFKVEEDGRIVDITGNRIIENERIKVAISIVKYEEGTTTKLAGAEIGIYYNKGNLVILNGKELKGITSSDGRITFDGLEPGTYYYKEITPPTGYELDKNNYKFIIKEDGTIEFENDTKGILYNKKHTINVEIRKVIKGTNIGIPGAEITLIDEENKEYKATTNQNGYVTFVGLQVGKTYKYKETKAPVGYKLNTAKYSFTVKEDETIIDIEGNRIIENEKITGSVEIVKYKYGTVVALQGAEIGIYDSKGKILVIDGKEQKAITNKQGKVIFSKIEPGTYYYKEITPPIGYKLNNNSYKFVINNLGEVIFEDATNGIIYNDLHLIEVPIRKIDGITKIGIPGVEITLVDEQGNKQTAITNKEGYVTFGGLQAGKTYTYKETKAVVGYEINSNNYKFIINADGTITDIEGNRIIINYPKDEEILIPIWKIDALTKQGLSGVEITLTDEQGNKQTAITNKEGYVIFANLKKGMKYTYQETKTLKGYKIDESKYSFKIEIDGTLTDIKGKRVIENYPIASIRIRKIDAITKLGVLEAVIGLFDEEGNPLLDEKGKHITKTTDSDGYVTFKDLPIGKIYYYKEMVSPVGYILNNNTYSFKIDTSGTIIDIDGTRIIENYPIVGEIEIFKTEAGTSKYLANTKIAIYNYESYIKGEEFIEELTTNTDGKVHFRNLPIGKYICKETSAPMGYNLDSKPLIFEINKEGKVVILSGNTIFENTLIPNEPNIPNDEPQTPNNKPDVPSNTEPIPDFVPDNKIPQTGQKAVGLASVILILTLAASGVETVILYKRYNKAKEYEKMKQKIRKM